MDNEKKSIGDWRKHFTENGSPAQAAELTAKFMFAMSYYHDRMRLHIMLHPLFYLAGFLTAYALT
ncbi:MAG: hypothetical protein VW270_03905 [Candidatus Poseidoniales archaeon]|jgi:hypothetical protein